MGPCFNRLISQKIGTKPASPKDQATRPGACSRPLSRCFVGERHFRIIVGIALLISLYFEIEAALWGVAALLLFEGVSNWRIPVLVSRLRYGVSEPITQAMDMSLVAASPPPAPPRSALEAERIQRFLAAALLILSTWAYPAQLWIVPWFLAFFLVAAGLSGICPTVVVLRKLGFS